MNSKLICHLCDICYDPDQPMMLNDDIINYKNDDNKNYLCPICSNIFSFDKAGKK